MPHIINIDKIELLGTVIAGIVLAFIVVWRVGVWWKNRKG